MLCSACSSAGAENPLQGEENEEGQSSNKKSQRIAMADPTIFLHEGKYYLSGTSQVGNQSSRGFTFLISDDLKSWRTDTDELYRFLLGPEWGTTFGSSGFWAPQWVREGDQFHLLYTANEQVAIAHASTPTGPFTQSEVRAIDPSVGNIDPFLFKDEDGKYYLYHVRFGGGNFIWTAEFDLATGTLNPSTLVKCMELTEPWERMYNYDTSWIMEGPTVVKWEGVYYLFYSANHFMDPDYAVGYATSTSPTGPWTKYAGNPILRRDIVGEKGAGHGDIFQDKEGAYYYVYHVWGDGDDPNGRQVRIIPLLREKCSDGTYRVSVDASRIIIPQQEYASSDN